MEVAGFITAGGSFKYEVGIFNLAVECFMMAVWIFTSAVRSFRSAVRSFNMAVGSFTLAVRIFNFAVRSFNFLGEIVNKKCVFWSFIKVRRLLLGQIFRAMVCWRLSQKLGLLPNRVC